MADGIKVFEGAMPARAGQIALETRGMAPIPLDNRYGGLHRVFTVWFAPNLVPAAFFVGVIAFNLGFALGAAAIGLGTLVGSLLGAGMCSWGPSTGSAQRRQARLRVGKSVCVPGRPMRGR